MSTEPFEYSLTNNDTEVERLSLIQTDYLVLSLRMIKGQSNARTQEYKHVFIECPLILRFVI